MNQNNDYDLLIVSDLHLSEGRDSKTGKYSPNEDFFYDEEFDRFLAYHEEKAHTANRKWKLIINGDMIDFLQVITHCDEKDIPAGINLTRTEIEFGPGTSPQKTIWKLDILIEGHAIFFAALSRFLSKGHMLIIIRGNHDIEFFWPEVQEHFKQYVGYGENIVFLPWFYYEKGRIFIEHGNQYEKVNSIHYFLHPILPAQLCPFHEKLIELPFGSFFVRYFFNKTEAIHPFADNIKPTTHYIAWAISNHFSTILKIIKKYAPLYLKVLKKIKKWPKEAEAEIKKIHNEKIANLEKKYELEGLLQKIDGLKETPVTTSKWAFLKIILQNTLTKIILALLVGIAVLYGIIRTIMALINLDIPLGNISLYLTALCFVIILISFFLYVFLGERSKAKLTAANLIRRPVKKISEILDVDYIAMGHTHTADIWHIQDSDTIYFNTSTWVPTYSEKPTLFRDNDQFVFLVVISNKAKLYRWDDPANRAEPIKLIEEDTTSKYS